MSSDNVTVEADDLSAGGASVKRRPFELRDAFYALGLITLVVTVLTLASEQLAPIALAALIWFLVNAIANGMRSVPLIGRLLGQSFALTLAAVLVVGAMFLGGRVVVSNVSELSEGFANIDQRLGSAIQSLEQAIGYSFGADLEAWLRDLRPQDFIGDVASAVAAAANYVLLVLTFVLFLLLDQPYYEAKIEALVPGRDRNGRVREVLTRIGSDTRLYIWIMTVVSTLVGLLTYGIALYFGLKAPAFWAFMAFALNFIPTIGSILGVLFPAIFAFVQFDRLEDVGAFIIALGVVQFFMGNILLPRLTGDRLNLSQFVVILSLTIWGTMWGVSGLFLAVPLMMVLAIVLSQFDATRPMAILMSQTGRVMGRR